jgi:Helix-turn-helix domain of resolvase/Resolvase, N terminal domain
MFNMLGVIAQFERELMLERQREGVAKAKAEGKYKGRAPIARAEAPEVRQLHKDGVGATEIARRLQISRASVYRVLGPNCLRRLQALLPDRLHYCENVFIPIPLAGLQNAAYVSCPNQKRILCAIDGRKLCTRRRVDDRTVFDFELVAHHFGAHGHSLSSFDSSKRIIGACWD